MNKTDTQERYTREELAKVCGVSGTQIMYWQFGRTRKQTPGSKVVNEPPILGENDYEIVRGKYYYFQTALEKIRSKQ